MKICHEIWPKLNLVKESLKGVNGFICRQPWYWPQNQTQFFQLCSWSWPFLPGWPQRCTRSHPQPSCSWSPRWSAHCLIRETRIKVACAPGTCSYIAKIMIWIFVRKITWRKRTIFSRWSISAMICQEPVSQAPRLKVSKDWKCSTVLPKHWLINIT